MRRHPPDDRLRAWLADDGDDDELTSHVESCERCADRLEALVDEPPAALSAALDEVLHADEELPRRMIVRVADTLSALDSAVAFFELFGIGVQTAQVVLTEGDQT